MPDEVNGSEALVQGVQMQSATLTSSLSKRLCQTGYAGELALIGKFNNAPGCFTRPKRAARVNSRMADRLCGLLGSGLILVPDYEPASVLL